MGQFSKSLLIIIVVYQRTLEDCESFRSIVGLQPDDFPLEVFVYDNSPQNQNVIHHKNINIKYVHDPQNSGVSKAYNEGAKYAAENRKEWVLLLDQDTNLPKCILEKYRSAINGNPYIDLFVPILKLKGGTIFSPSLYKFKRGFFLKNIEVGKHSLNRYAPVNSGMMVRTSAFLDVGGYNEEVQLDFSDFQFIERFRKKHPDFVVIDAECGHDFSNDEGTFESQSMRFQLYCKGARNVENKSHWDWHQYNLVVFIRALRLTLRYRNTEFLGTYFRNFLFA